MRFAPSQAPDDRNPSAVGDPARLGTLMAEIEKHSANWPADRISDIRPSRASPDDDVYRLHDLLQKVHG